MRLILDGIRVLDLGRFLAAPYCSLLLADMGAEVIRIERPGGEWDRTLGAYPAPNGDTYMFMSRARNKKCITLDFHTPRGREILGELVRLSDVVIENFGTGAKKAIGVDYESLKQFNPKIILTSVSAFGLNGPYARRLGMDGVAQAMSGAMSCSGFPGSPPTKLHASWVDYSTATHAALGTVLALYHRDRTGMGQMLDVSLFDVAVNCITLQGMVGEYKMAGLLRPQMGNGSAAGYSDCLKAKDGWVMFITHGTIWRRFLKLIDMPELADDPRFKEQERAKHHEELGRIISPWFAERSVKEIIDLMENANVPCGVVNSVADVIDDPQVKAREMLVDVEHVPGTMIPAGGVVIKLSETPGQIKRGAPLLGQDNSEIYRELLGFTEQQLAELKTDKII